jgi:CRP/FNR family transcriptional regulator, cyclic AMP receptor protein
MAGKDKRVERLSEVSIFRALSRKEIEALARATDTVGFGAGTTLVKEGEAGREFFVILEGAVSVTVAGQEVAVLKDGEWFGELAIIDPAPRDATVTTLSPCELLVIDGRRFLPLLEELPVLANKILVGLARRLREADRARVWQG